MLVVPAVLPSSRTDLEEKLTLFAALPSISRVQIDVVDGTFATPASWPYTAPHELSQMAEHGEMLPYLDRISYEIDLMCTDAESAIETWLTLGATRLTLHAESTTDLPRLFAFVREQYGAGTGFAPDLISFGLAIHVTSDLLLIEQVVNEIEYVQFMGIARVGLQGQRFDERVFEQVRVFRTRHPEMAVQVDGGITLDSAKKLVVLGVSNLVIGSGILKAKDPAVALAAFEALESSYGV